MLGVFDVLQVLAGAKGREENTLLHNFISILQVIDAIALVALLAIQTSKAEQGGVMGIGAAGGRGAGEIDMLVGSERILKPLTKWVAIAFLFLSLLAAIPTISIVHVLVLVVLYVLVMLFGNNIWKAITGR